LAAPIVGIGRRRQRGGQEGKGWRFRQRRERRALTIAAAEASSTVGGRLPDWLPLKLSALGEVVSMRSRGSVDIQDGRGDGR